VKIEDPLAHLKMAQAEDYKTYLLWRRDHSRVTREGSLERYWKTLSMHYMRTAKRYIDEGIMLDIRNVCGLSHKVVSLAVLTS
jgi:hypothetical protein